MATIFVALLAILVLICLLDAHWKHLDRQRQNNAMLDYLARRLHEEMRREVRR